MTVDNHSIVWQYPGAAEPTAIVHALRAAGARATGDAPLAWLRPAPPAGTQSPVELRVTTWPGGDEQLLALAGFHRDPVRWIADV
jgi:hypothetical protein